MNKKLGGIYESGDIELLEKKKVRLNLEWHKFCAISAPSMLFASLLIPLEVIPGLWRDIFRALFILAVLFYVAHRISDIAYTEAIILSAKMEKLSGLDLDKDNEIFVEQLQDSVLRQERRSKKLNSILSGSAELTLLAGSFIFAFCVIYF